MPEERAMNDETYRQLVEPVREALSLHVLRWERKGGTWRYWCECGQEFEPWQDAMGAARRFPAHQEEAVLDAVLSVPQSIKCETCGGRGDGPWDHTCGVCGGTGSVPGPSILVFRNTCSGTMEVDK